MSMNAWVEAKRSAAGMCFTSSVQINGVSIIGLPDSLDIGAKAKGTCNPSEGKGVVSFECKDGKMIAVGGGCKSKLLAMHIGTVNEFRSCLSCAFVCDNIMRIMCRYS